MTKHLFVIDPVEKLNMKLDTSMQLVSELVKTGDQVSLCEMTSFQWHSGESVASASCREALQSSQDNLEIGASTVRKLDEFGVIHMRKDPPFDINYVAATWFLDTALPKTRILNHPNALRALNEKLVTLKFPKDIVPTLVSSSADEIFQFLRREAHSDVIIKPFDMFGGHGIVRMKKSDGKSESEMVQELKILTENGQKLRIVQPFQKQIFDGEVRCFVFGPDPIAWTLKRPAPGSFMANTRLGATLEKYRPSVEEIERASRVGRELSQMGVWMIGFDMIGGKITEINVTSPRLLSAPDEMKADHQLLARKIQQWAKG